VPVLEFEPNFALSFKDDGIFRVFGEFSGQASAEDVQFSTQWAPVKLLLSKGF
jgi:hypothetical protein